MATLAYPVTRYEPPAPVDLGSAAERKRLSVSGLKAVFRIAGLWRLRDEDVRQLLGGITNGPYYALKKNPAHRALTEDEIYRVSYLIGIFKALNILHGKPLADDWVQLPNSNRIFAGHTPLEYMLRGGVPAMQTVRRLLDARRGGL